MQLISKDGKAIPHLGGICKNPGGILLLSTTTKTYPALIDQGNLLKSDWDTYSRYDSQNKIWCSTVEKSVTANSSLLSPTVGVNNIPTIQLNPMTTFTPTIFVVHIMR